MTVKNRLSDNVEKVKDFVQEHTGLGGGIRPHLPVYASDGVMIGVVDRLEGDQIKLTRKESTDDQHHYVPTDWVQNVDDAAVRLSKPSVECQTGMQLGGSCDC
ncbi:MAG: DUF2171 domain-containing protein [Fimbriiglobus sp.]|jgi:hypothetical protein|nr:DUF2171 domain-containing protein [Fimbriiglobus sp.]